MLQPSFTMESPERLSENARQRREAAESLPPGPDRAALLLDAASLQTLAETFRWLKALPSRS
jgi:hypothetical protein